MAKSFVLNLDSNGLPDEEYPDGIRRGALILNGTITKVENDGEVSLELTINWPEDVFEYAANELEAMTVVTDITYDEESDQHTSVTVIFTGSGEHPK